MQIRFLKILIVLLLPMAISAQSLSQKLQQGDSLFRAKQYTQAFSMYQSVLSGKNYTPSMLLKMAYIQEGLGHVGSCLYYLNLYHLASGDEQASTKMEELAQKFQLEGYQLSQQKTAQEWLLRHLSSFSFLLVGGSFFLLGLAFARKNKRKIHLPFSITSCIMVVFAIWINNLNTTSIVIVSHPHTYVLDAPSAGGAVLEILKEGHRMEAKGTKDVWKKVIWRGKEVYIKNNHLNEVKI
ncbi:MAG: hypothetical protein ACKO96_43655 [Flammeovirgaceae bacterium]